MWAGAIHSGVRVKDAKLCALTVFGVDKKDHKHLLAIEDGPCESTQSWCEGLLKLKQRGMRVPNLSISDGELGFWAASDQTFPVMLHMIFKFSQCAQKRWCRLRGFDHLANLIRGVKFKDEIKVKTADQIAA